MLDIGFAELLLVAIVILVVMGPERLPQTVRSLSLWVGRARQTFTAAKRELEREVGLDDIREQLHNEKIMRDIAASKEQLEQVKADADSALGDNQESASDPAAGGRP